MDREYHEEKAKEFSRLASCYVHAEMDSGVLELMISGEGNALIHTISKMII